MRISILPIVLATVILLSSASASSSLNVSSSGVITSSPVGRWFDYIVVIMLENHQINHTYGMPVTPNTGWNTGSQTCLGNCTYFNNLADANGFAESYTNHLVKGSLGDYIAITSGDGSVSCNSPPGGTCGPFPDTNIADRIENHGLTWKAYMEGYPIALGCANSDNPSTHYSTIHNPFIYYQDISGSARCNNIVNANSVNAPQTNPCWPNPPQNDNLFIGNLSSTATASNYMFLTPSSIDDAHDCNDISLTNLWLNQTIPQILNSFVFRTQRAALFITFDEPDCTSTTTPPHTCPNPPKGYPLLYTVWASNPAIPTTIGGHKSVAVYDHFSLLRTVEDNWNLPTITSNDASAMPMSEFLRP